MRVALIVPTYNEAGGIGEVLQNLARVFAANPSHEWRVVVVDGNSPDGTGRVVEAMAQTYPGIHLVTEKNKGGIGAAYCVGFSYAIQTLGADTVISFDGDGQHNEADIPRLVKEIEDGNDYTIGSRYIVGGSVPSEWAPHRKLLSRFGSLYARILLELPMYDVTSGFRAMRVKGFLEKLPMTREELVSPHYAYIFEYSYIATILGAKIKEVPINFRTRENDVSKQTAVRGMIESLRVTGVLRLRHLRRWRLLRVLAIGVFGLALQTLLFEIVGIRLHLFLPSTVLVLGSEVAILSNFFLNERFSFGDRVSRSADIVRRLVRFHIVASGSVIIQWLCVRGTETVVGLSPIPLNIAYIVGIALGFIVTYSGYYFWVWREEKA